MKLTEDNCFAHDIGLLIKCDNWEETEKQILEDQKLRELLEKYIKEIEDYCDNDDGVACTSSLFGLQKILKDSKK